MSLSNQYLKTVLLLPVFCLFINSSSVYAELTHFPKPYRSNANMSILILEIKGIDVASGSELAVFTPDSVIAGAIELIGDPPWGLAVWADDEATPESDGFIIGDSMRFVFWDPVGLEKLDAVVSEIVEGTQLQFVTDGFLVLRLYVYAFVPPPAPVESKRVSE